MCGPARYCAGGGVVGESEGIGGRRSPPSAGGSAGSTEGVSVVTPSITELDLNPTLVTPDGACAVDVRLKVR